jgi:hypothetical protein
MRENKETWAKKVEEYQKILDDTGNEKFWDKLKWRVETLET